MWHVDIYCDFAWIEKQNGVLGEPRFRIIGNKSKTLGVSIDKLIYGDEYNVRHLRILVHTDDEKIGLKCINLNINLWIESFETAVSMATGRPFRIAYFPGTFSYAVGSGLGDESCPAIVIQLKPCEPTKIDYATVGMGMAAWAESNRYYLFYFHRFIDDQLPLDVRWLNGYRLLEWHFVKDRAWLSKSKEWQQFANRFGDHFKSLLRPKQKVVGLLEETRALAAHAGVDNRSEEERVLAPKNKMEKTFRILERMVMAVLNEHLSHKEGNSITLQSRWPESEMDGIDSNDCSALTENKA